MFNEKEMKNTPTEKGKRVRKKETVNVCWKNKNFLAGKLEKKYRKMEICIMKVEDSLFQWQIGRNSGIVCV